MRQLKPWSEDLGKKTYVGGSTILTHHARFESFDPAEESPTNANRVGSPTPVSPSNEYQQQLSVQLRIVLEKIADFELGRAKKKSGIYIPIVFQKEISEYNSLSEWARSKPGYLEVLRSRGAVE